MKYSVDIWPIQSGTVTRLQQVFFPTLKGAREFAKVVSIQERVLSEVYRHLDGNAYMVGEYNNGSYSRV